MAERSHAGGERVETRTPHQVPGLQQVSRLGGFPLISEVRPSLGQSSVSITLDGAPGAGISLPARELGKADPGTLVTSTPCSAWLASEI
jgi:hypothetical protein